MESTRPIKTAFLLSARQAALLALADAREGRQTARMSLDALIEKQNLSPADAALATELVMGVVRHRMTLVRVLSGLTSRGWQRVGRQLQHILMIGAYQLLWLDGIPEFAAVSEAVNAAKLEGGPAAGRFVNAILRQLLRDIDQRRIACDQVDPKRAIPINREYCCQLVREIFPEPSQHPVEYLADSFSMPTWLVKRWMGRFGLPKTKSLCRTAMLRPPVFLRPNTLRITTADLLKRLVEEGFDAKLSPRGDSVVIEQTGGLAKSRTFTEGLFQPQDRSAMQVVERMKLSPGEVVLDLCAGLGTKTTQMGEAMRNEGTIIATDKDEPKLDALHRNCERLGLKIVRTVPLNRLSAALPALPKLDWILIDAPCSNSGVLARRPEARYRISAASIEALTRTQCQLLSQAAALARPGTRIMYSTCSIEPDENEDICEQFVAIHPEWLLRDSHLAIPDAGTTPEEWRDGSYWVIWSRAVEKVT